MSHGFLAFNSIYDDLIVSFQILIRGTRDIHIFQYLAIFLWVYANTTERNILIKDTDEVRKY